MPRLQDPELLALLHIVDTLEPFRPEQRVRILAAVVLLLPAADEDFDRRRIVAARRFLASIQGAA
jgi:hypothetical protein